MNYFKSKKGEVFIPTYQNFKLYNSIKEDRKVKLIIPYKKASRAVKDKVKKIRKKWLTHRNFLVRPFVFQFRKIYLRSDGIQENGHVPYHIWTILYNRNSFHRNNTTIAVGEEKGNENI